VEVGILYMAAWLGGQGAVPIHNLMEDAATAEISRAQLWQWRTHAAKLDTGQIIDAEYLQSVFAKVDANLRAGLRDNEYAARHIGPATKIMRKVVFSDEFAEFLTLPAYRELLAEEPN